MASLTLSDVCGLEQRRAHRLLKQAELSVLRDTDFWFSNASAWSLTQDTLRAMRADSVDVFRMVAVPAQEPKIRRKPQFDNDGIPTTASYAVLSVMASGICAPVPFRVIYGQKLLRILATANAAVSIVSEYGSFVAGRLLALPIKSVSDAATIGSVRIRSGFDAALATENLAAHYPTLGTDTSGTALLEPRPLCEFLFIGEHERGY